MVTKNRGRRIARFLSRLFQGQTPNRKSQTTRRQVSHANRSAEHLENRALLTLVGVDFGNGGIVPANWTSHDGNFDTGLLNLDDEDGNASGVNLDIDFDDLPGTYDSFTPLSAEIPAHSASLVGLEGNYEDQGSVQLTWQNLIAGQTYEIYIFAGDTFADTQTVTISDAAAGTTLTTFQQPHAANQLIVNDQIGDSTRALGDYALQASADANGDLTITVGSNPGTFFGLAGVALGIPTPPSQLYLNEIVAEVPGQDNPNEYVELRGQV